MTLTKEADDKDAERDRERLELIMSYYLRDFGLIISNFKQRKKNGQEDKTRQDNATQHKTASRSAIREVQSDNDHWSMRDIIKELKNCAWYR